MCAPREKPVDGYPHEVDGSVASEWAKDPDNMKRTNSSAALGERTSSRSLKSRAQASQSLQGCAAHVCLLSWGMPILVYLAT